ncbi:hypothetical protein BDY21DRAFT_385517 [Lineolata rhizophorae]|uniref:RRM domain-containing protein n=1 Tax=Lineolata rhizophorae TaxID=578093 RepID=A0A6A6P2X5_9PEZI|nr:hypothetical protein BDY21DRAFT_385517 [Lineolata rhizophorae]
MATTVHVKNISHETSEKQITDFFNFCGKIQSISVTPVSDAPDAEKTASVTFEKEAAAKTALLLDSTQLGPSQIQVSSAASIDELAGNTEEERSPDDVPQEEKPRTRILAEYLAHGYEVRDIAIKKAIELDNKHGIWNRFNQTLTDLDARLKATEKAKTVNAKLGLSQKAAAGWRGAASYYEDFTKTGPGGKFHKFYLDSSKMVKDVRDEAERLKELKQQAAAEKAGTEDHKEIEHEAEADTQAGAQNPEVPTATATDTATKS